jgi:mRNA-degrading endonuclease toxin of MazEF toxin-antitoxin module
MSLLNQIRTVDMARIVGVFGIADAKAMSTVDETIRLTLGLSEL